MKPSQPDPLAHFVDQQLKALPELTAPPSLAPRILAAVAARTAAAPATGWLAWPLAWRVASFACLAVVFLGLCLSGWQFTQSATLASATNEVHGWLAGLKTLAGALTAVLNALVFAVKQLGPVWLSVFAAVIAAGWISCLGLGTAFTRLVWHRRSFH